MINFVKIKYKCQTWLASSLCHVSQLIVLSALAKHCGKVWVTVSSLWRPIAACDKVVDAELEINWEFDSPEDTRHSDAQIKVFTADPLAAHSNTFYLPSSQVLYPKNWWLNGIKIAIRIVMHCYRIYALTLSGTEFINYKSQLLLQFPA
jgi:hypothetical protein